MASQNLDRWAIWLSGACLLHCLAISVAVLLLPTVAGLLVHSETGVHWLFLTIAIPISAIALGSGYRQHRSWLRLAIGTAGLALMFVGVSHIAGKALEPPLTISGVSLVVLAHLLNIRQTLAASDPTARD
jgi:hypothetical protein